MKKILLAALLISSGASAQTVWDIKTCIDYALEHNLTVKQRQNTVQLREIDVNTAEGRRLPNLNASASQNFSFGRGLAEDNTYVNANTTSTSFVLGTEIPIFNGFDITRGIKLSKLELAAATEDLEKARNDIRVSVAQAYIQVLYNKEILTVARNQVQRDSLQLVRITEMAKNSKASNSEVAAQQSILAQGRVSEVQAENSLRLSTLDLTQLLELTDPEGFDIVAPDASKLEPRLLPSPNDIYAAALDIRPEIRSQELRLDYAQLNILRAKGGYLPSLNLSGGLGSNYYTSSGIESKSFGGQINNNFSQYIGLSLNIPIFNRFSIRNQVRTAQVSFNNQELQLENVKKSLYKEIQQVYYNALASQAKMLSSKEAASSAEVAFLLTTGRYENGKADITEYNDAKNRYLEAESNYIRARYECLFQNSLVDFYQGKELNFCKDL
ncbi:MAG: TolC family protein [Bacteroidales bacterium]|nr:TolC family protein [Bacteroidales bacterium]